DVPALAGGSDQPQGAVPVRRPDFAVQHPRLRHHRRGSSIFRTPQQRRRWLHVGDAPHVVRLLVGQGGLPRRRPADGDFFFAEFLLDSDHAIGARLEGSILDVARGRHLSLDKHGLDPWVRENWPKFEGSGPTVRLHAAPAWGMLAEKLALPFL